MSRKQGPDQEPEQGDEEVVGRALRERVERVPPEVAERLSRMRREAVAELDRRQPRRFRPALTTTGLVGTAAALGLTVAFLFGRPAEPRPDALLLAEADELAAMAEMEVLEDLEFLAWLEQEQLDDEQS